MSKMLFFYLGDDEAYFKALQGEFSQKNDLQIEFRRLSGTNDKEIQSLLIQVFEARPTCVFVDLSKSVDDYLHLARIIVRTTMEHKLVTVGLVDYLSPPEILAESIATGVHLTYIKSSETFDVVYGVTRILGNSPEKKGHDFATATLNDELEAGLPAKIGFLHPEGAHFETDQRLEKATRVRLRLAPALQKLIPSQQGFVTSISQTNVFYQFNYAIDAEFLFVDEFIPPEGMSEGDVEEKRVGRFQEIDQRRDTLRTWLRDRAGSSKEKRAKVLVVDRTLSFYRDQQRSDRFPYTIRCLPFFRSMDEELRRHRPDVIAFALEPSEAPEGKNRRKDLGALIEVIKTGPLPAPPFIVVFNCKTPSKELQAELQYDKVMAIENEISVELLLRMADAFEKKLLRALPKEENPEILYLGKSNPDSLAELVIPITVRKMSECDMIFSSETTLMPGAILRLQTPVGLSLHVLPLKASGKVPEYLGVIHALGEEDKQELRRFINSVFFRQHDAKLEAESEEFKKLNETKLQEREEALQKAATDAEADAENIEIRSPAASSEESKS